MATVAEFTVPAEEFPLGTVFRRQPRVTVELDRLVPTNRDVVPYFWVYDGQLENVEGAFASHPGISDVTIVDAVSDEYLLRVEWAPEYHGILEFLTNTPTALISVRGTSAGWTFEIRGDDRQSVSDLIDTLWDHDIPVTLTTIHDLGPVTFREFDVTDAQREALTLAHARGYFELPRRVAMAELAAELDISRQAFGDRLRRGLDGLLDDVLGQSTDGASSDPGAL